MGVTHNATILIAEDDDSLRGALGRVLEYEGYAYHSVRDGAAAISAISEHQPTLIILDWVMPFMGGLDVCRELRAKGVRTPILVLTARGEVEDLVEALDAGADDFMSKPFSMEALLARIRALLRRQRPGAGPRQACGLILDTARRTVSRDGRQVDLTRTEFELLNMLVEHPGVVLPRSTMYERVWGHDFDGDSKSLDVHISYLRRKLEAGGEDRVIQTERGIGYVLREVL